DDTDGGRALGVARPSAARTPSRPAQTPVAKPEDAGGTLILNPPAAAAAAKKPATPAQPFVAAGAKRPTSPPRAVAAPKPSVPQRPVGAADTLLDAGGPLLAADDEVPGGTAMLRPGQPLPMPPPRTAPRPTDTLPDVPE